MASVNSPIRRLVKPFLFKMLGKRGYKWVQYYAKKRDIKYRLVEEIEMELLPQLIKHDDEVLDIGANYAYYTERLSKLATDGRIYAFEPIPFTYEVASMIVKKFRLKNVNLYQKGLGEKTEILRFSVPKLSFGSMVAGLAHMAKRDNNVLKGTGHFVSDDTNEFDAEVVDIDSFLLPELKKLSFVKIDIEGAEYFALKGMEKTLDKFKPVILIEIVALYLRSFNIELSFFQEYIQDTLGYKIYKYDKDSKKLIQQIGPIDDERNFFLIHSINVNAYKNLIA